MATNYVPCPKCGGRADRLNFTWWGGVLGPRLLSHVKCTRCSHKYNGKSGKDNTTGIVIYSAIIAILVFGLIVVMLAAMAVITMSTR
jgi:DNA-directed RNA polymerase subunit RPC12/RpoP